MVEQITAVSFAAGGVLLHGGPTIRLQARGMVLVAHGSGSSRNSPRNQFVARALNENRLATLLIDLFTSDEEVRDALSGHIRFDIPLLADRVVGATDWVSLN